MGQAREPGPGPTGNPLSHRDPTRSLTLRFHRDRDGLWASLTTSGQYPISSRLAGDPGNRSTLLPIFFSWHRPSRRRLGPPLKPWHDSLVCQWAARAARTGADGGSATGRASRPPAARGPGRAAGPCPTSHGPARAPVTRDQLAQADY
jgi:hypothetical protein